MLFGGGATATFAIEVLRNSTVRPAIPETLLPSVASLVCSPIRRLNSPQTTLASTDLVRPFDRRLNCTASGELAMLFAICWGCPPLAICFQRNFPFVSANPLASPR
jgi:hypothetical protein